MLLKSKNLWRALALFLAAIFIFGLFPAPEARAYNATKDMADGETYYFDLSAFTGVAGGSSATGYINTSGSGALQELAENLQVPDSSFKWLPFVYTGNINTYVLNSNSQGVYFASTAAAANAVSNRGEAISSAYGGAYSHSLFLSEYVLTHYTSWDRLKFGTAYGDLIFGTNYLSNGTAYIMRSLSGGSANATGGASGSTAGSNLSNSEWDTLYAKGGRGTIDSDENTYLKNNLLSTGNTAGRRIRTWTQDTPSGMTEGRVLRGGYSSIRYWMGTGADYVSWGNGWRPALESPEWVDLTSLKLIVREGALNGADARVPLATAKIVYERNGSLTLPEPESYTGESRALKLGWFTNADFTGNYYETGKAYGAGEFDNIAALYYGGAPYHAAYVNGYPDGYFRPDENLTRAEAAAITARMIYGALKLDKNYTASFTDVEDGNWYASYAGYLQQLGIISGTDFRPEEDIMIAEFAEYLEKAASYMAIEYSLVWLGEVRPLTRAEAVGVTNILLGRDSVTAESIAGCNYTCFPDVLQSEDYFYDIIEASNSHSYSIKNGIEIWS